MSDSSSLYILLNDEMYQLYELDTIESLKIRISTNQPVVIPQLTGSLIPNLIILQENIEVSSDEKIVAGCRAIHIKRPPGVPDGVNPLTGRKFKLIDFFNTVSAQLKKAGHDSAKHKKAADEIMTLFGIADITTYVKYVIYFVFGGMERLLTEISPVIRLGFRESIEKDMGLGSFEIIRSQYDLQAQEMNQLVQANLGAMRKDLNLFASFDRELGFEDREPIQSSDIQLTKTLLSVNFQIATDVYELFNGLLLSPNIPFISVGDFYKVLKTFKPPKEWAVKFEQDDLLIMYVLNRRRESERNKVKADPKSYSPVYISPISVDETTHIASMEMSIESRIDDELREEHLIGRIFEAFPFPVNNCTYEQKRIEADYLLLAPGSLDIPLFYDMVMNDPLISQMMVIDESVRTFRERGGIFSYFRYNSHVVALPKKPLMSCNINIGVVEPAQQVRAPEIFSDLGELYISCKMRNINNSSEAERFRGILNRILEYYYS